MQWSISRLASVSILIFPACAVAEPPNASSETVAIPLDQIWAYDMPGTRVLDDRRDARGYVAPEGTFVDGIRRSLSALPAPSNDPAKRGFAVAGTDDEALAQVHAVLSGKLLPRPSFPAGSDIRIVFFSKPSHCTVELESVTRFLAAERKPRRANVIEIRYRLVPAAKSIAPAQLALIPISGLAQGQIQVRFLETRASDQQQGHSCPIGDSIVCQSFSFAGIREPFANESNRVSEVSTWPKSSVAVPLDEVLATEMPGTHPMPPSSILQEILQLLSPHDEKGAGIHTGFIVEGAAMEALRNAHSIFANKITPRFVFPSCRQITLVFFSRPSGMFVHLHEVVRNDRHIEVRYRFVPHASANVTEHFALVPLGVLPPGEYQVDVIKSPMAEKWLDLGFNDISAEQAAGIVCKPFTFRVGGDESDR